MEVETFLIGECGLSFEQAYLVTFREYQIRLKAFIDRVSREWGYVRRIVFNMIVGNPHIKKEAKPKNEKDLFRLPNEVNKPVRKTTMTPEEARMLRSCGLNVYEGHIS